MYPHALICCKRFSLDFSLISGDYSRQFIANKHNPQEEYPHPFLQRTHNISVFISKKSDMDKSYLINKAEFRKFFDF
jgi:hypothetical protein